MPGKEKHSVLDDVLTIAQIAAIVIGGIWVFFTFSVSEYPSLHGSSTIVPTLAVNYVDNKMHLSFLVTIKNNGKKDFDVLDPVLIQLWMIPAKTLTKSSYFSWEDYMKKKPDFEIKDSVYDFTFKPNDTVGISHNFFVPDTYKDTAKYTVLARAKAHFKFSTFFGCDRLDSDYAYTVKIRYKTLDPGDPEPHKTNAEFWNKSKK